MKKNKNLTQHRKGALTLELVLIFPILMLLFFLFFQVSVMLLTYHSLQTIASHAALTATTASSVDEITAVVNAGVADWYYEPSGALAPTTSADWKKSNLQFRILRQSGSGWVYVESSSDLPASGTNVMVEIRLASPRFWLMSQFKGVDSTASPFYVSAMGRRL